MAYSFDDIVNQLLRLVDLLFSIGHDETVEIFLLVARMGGVGASLAFLDGAFATNRDLGSGFCFHLLQCVATRADK